MANLEARKMQLFAELKHQFPEIPDIIVTNCIHKFPNNRERCLEYLSQESPKYLYCFVDTMNASNLRKFQDLGIHGESYSLPGPSYETSLNATFIHDSNLPQISSQVEAVLKSPQPGNNYELSGHVSNMNRPTVTNSGSLVVNYNTPKAVYMFSNYRSQPVHQTVCNVQVNPTKSQITTTQPHAFCNNKGYHIPNQSSPVSANQTETSLGNPPFRSIPTSGSQFYPSSHIISSNLFESNSGTTSSSLHSTSVNLHLKNPFLHHPLFVHTNNYNPSSGIESPSANTKFTSQVKISLSPSPSKSNLPGFNSVTTTPYSNVSFSDIPFDNSRTSYRKFNEPNVHLLTSTHPEQENITQQPIQPVSPASSTSSLNSESTKNDIRKASTSSQEDYAYTQALLLHQRARMERLKREYEEEEKKLDSIRSEVSGLEQELLERSNSNFPTAEQITKLRQENRNLQIEIECMTREIDLFDNGQVPLGVTDQNFYRNMGMTGQQGPVRPPPPGARRPSPPPPLPAQLQEPDEGQHWSCSACTFLNHPALDKCEWCEMPRITLAGVT